MPFNPIHQHVVMLLQALSCTVSPNYRRIALWYDRNISKVQFVLEKDNDVDRQYISETEEDYGDLIFKEDIFFETVISDNTLPELSGGPWVLVYCRRENFSLSVHDLRDNININVSKMDIPPHLTERLKPKELTEQELIERNRRIFFLNQALCSMITPNFRVVSLGWKKFHNKLRFTFEHDDISDFESIYYIAKKYYMSLNNEREIVDVEIYVSGEDIPHDDNTMEMNWYWAYTRRTYFEDWRHEWVPLNSLDDMTGFRRHKEWIDEKIRLGKIVEINVMKPLFTNSNIEERWYQKESGEIWRLLKPLDDFNGLFEKVPDIQGQYRTALK